jgi:hypothetical protein
MAFCQPAAELRGMAERGASAIVCNGMVLHSSDRFEASKVAKIYYLVFIFRAYTAAAALGP